MTLEQTGVPENEVEKTKAGWKNYYWNPIKFTFGFGVEIS
jgi:activator of HSP90 ATPase